MRRPPEWLATHGCASPLAGERFARARGKTGILPNTLSEDRISPANGSSGRRQITVALLALAAAICRPTHAQETGAPTPKAVIYPGDVIRDDMLVDGAEGGVRDSSGPYVASRALIVGKVARATLLPGHAIPYASISNRKLVANGAEVKLVFAEDGLLIMTTGAALQDGSIGDVVRVRNSDSGVTVSGAVQPDGSVMVGG